MFQFQDGFARFLSVARRAADNLLRVVASLIFLPVAVLAWGGFFAVAGLGTLCSGRSLTLANTAQRKASRTFALSSPDCAGGLRTTASSRFFGSLNSKRAARRTTTSSQIDGFPETLYRKPGSSALEAATPDILLLERASKNLSGTGQEPSPTRKNTLGSKNKRNCRLCSQLRAWVAGGAS